MRRSSLGLPAGDFSYLEDGEGPPVVFLHALGRSGADWTAIMEGMHDAFRCLALDQRGHGQSARCVDYTFQSMEEDLRTFVDALHLDRFHLVGHSMGGTVAWLFAERTPERLLGMVLEDTPPPSGRHAYPEIPATPPEPVPYHWEVRRQLFRQLDSPDPAWWADMERVTTPTLLISGSADHDELEEATSRLANGQRIAIEAGHWIHETRPDAFIRAVRTFLEV